MTRAVDSGSWDRQHSVPNQLLFRELNEQLARTVLPQGTIEIVCECRCRSCDERLTIRRERYESVRAVSTRFVLRPGHSIGTTEQVVERGSDFVVVELTGPAAQTAIRLDPRRGTGAARSAA